MEKKEVARACSFIIALSVIGILIASYLAVLHYSDFESFCDISKGLSCDIVNKSEYSVFPPLYGIPVSILGIFTFIIIITLALLIKRGKPIAFFDETVKSSTLAKLLLLICIISLLFAAYLVFTEAFLILSFCILCLILDTILIIIAIKSYQLKRSLS